jgi:hypothetical protein
MPRKKILIVAVSAIVLILIAGGVFYYLKYYQSPKEEPVQTQKYGDMSEEQLLEKMGHPETKYQFDGVITKIDLINKILTVKVERVFNFTNDFTADYIGKSYNFIASDNTKFSQITTNKSNDFNIDAKDIAIEGLKINDRVLLIVPIEEISKNDNFLLESAALMIFE